MKEIAIVSKSKALARLIELEAQSLGVSSRILSSLPKDSECFSVVFVDANCVDIASAFVGENVVEIGVGESDDEQRKLGCLPSLVKIREYITYSGDTTKIIKSSEPVGDKKIIYIDERQSSVRVDRESYQLSAYEMKLLKYLCERSDASVSRAELSKLLGAECGNICDVYICRLRKKLERNGERKVIYTVRNQGYMTRYNYIMV